MMNAMVIVKRCLEKMMLGEVSVKRIGDMSRLRE